MRSGLALYSVEAHTNTNVSNVGSQAAFQTDPLPKRTIERQSHLAQCTLNMTYVLTFAAGIFAGIGKA